MIPWGNNLACQITPLFVSLIRSFYFPICPHSGKPDSATLKIKIPQLAAGVIWLCGERGIRTPGTLLRYTRFPGVPVKPLLHLSIINAHGWLKNRGANYKNIFIKRSVMKFLLPVIYSEIVLLFL